MYKFIDKETTTLLVSAYEIEKILEKIKSDLMKKANNIYDMNLYGKRK